MKNATRIVMGGLTHPGRVRGENEDCIVTRAELGIAVLADGMGGHQAGEVASRMAVDVITEHLARRPPAGRSPRKGADRHWDAVMPTIIFEGIINWQCGPSHVLDISYDHQCLRYSRFAAGTALT